MFRRVLILCLAALVAQPALVKGQDSVSSAYVLAVNDQVQIDVYQEDDLRTSTKISQDGTIIFPLLGSVRLAGLTLSSATARLTELLRKDYLVKPVVTMTVVSFSKKRFTILGQVNSPGIKELPDQEGMDILDAIGLAGGYTRIANPSRITVKRGSQVIQIDGKAAAKGEGRKFQVQAGDTITVAESIF
ncbi:MAG: polysaccharide export protein [Verrucomicrobia bacterium]|nr:polysaccharide export protein [Verrucomicrobiota bacterium]